MLAHSSNSNIATAGSNLSWLESLRNKAVEKTITLAWPTVVLEDYRRTDLSSFPFDSFVPYFNSINGGTVDSFFPELSTAFIHNNTPVYVHNTSADVQVKLFSHLTEKESAFFSEQYQKELVNLNDKITVWNYEKLHDGLFIDIKDSMDLRRPVVIEYYVDVEKSLVIPNIFIRAHALSQGTIVVIFRGAPGVEACVNSVIHSYAEYAANLHIVKVQNLSLESTLFHHEKNVIDRSAVVKNHDIHFGGKLVKSKMEIYMNGKDGTFDAQGLSFSLDQHFDSNVLIHHKEPKCISRALYKNCVDGKGKTVFQGLIDVEEKAVATDAYLSNKNLILSDGAHADSIPSLHIANSNVKCSHGSTSGKINKEELFYLESRGFSKADARATIVSGFLGELIEGLPEEVKQYVELLIAERAGSTVGVEDLKQEALYHG